MMNVEYHTRSEILSRFESLGIHYLTRPVLEYPPLELFDPRGGGYYSENREEIETLSNLYASRIREGKPGPVYIKSTLGMGQGLFAHESFESGEYVGEYTGIIRESQKIPIPDDNDTQFTEENPLWFETAYAWNYPECFDGVDLEIDAEVAGNEMRFVNHSFHPNLSVEHAIVDDRWVIFYRARHDIMRDEQLFVNYGEEYWEGRYARLVLEWE